MGFGTMLHPAKTMDCVQGGRKCHSLAASWLIIAAVFATRLLFLYCTVAYPFQDVELRDINFMLEFIQLDIAHSDMDRHHLPHIVPV